MKRILLNRKYLIKQATIWTSRVFAILGLLGTFVSLNDLLDNQLSIGCRIMISAFILLVVWVVSFILKAVFVIRKDRYEILEFNGGYHVYVQYGDLFSENVVMSPMTRRNVVIPVNRCFDTIVDDDLISSNSLQGIALEKIYESGAFDEVSLNAEIQRNLHDRGLVPVHITRGEKRKGNLDRYPVGTVAEVRVSDTCTYFFLGLSTFDSNLKAVTSDDDYVLALMRLLEFCDDRSQQFPVVMPLVGGGLSRTEKNEWDILKFIISLVKLNKEYFHCDIHIVVRDSGKDSIPITDILEEQR